MKYAIWDKTSEIDGRSPDYIIANNSIYGEEPVYIFRHDNGDLFDILALSMIPNPDGLTEADEIIAAYISVLNAPPTDPIADLQAENATLRAQIAALTQSTQFLEDCLVEMAETVYA